MLKCLLVVSFTLLSFFNVYSQSADKVLEDYFDALGGRTHLENLETMIMVGNSEMMGMEFPVTMYQKIPSKTYTELDFMDKKIVTAYDGKTAWTINPMANMSEPTVMSEKEAESMKTQKLRDELLDYKSLGYEISYEGEQELEGKSYDKLKVVKTDKTTEYLYFDTSTHLKVAQEVTVQEGDQTGKKVFVYFDDYRQVGSLKFPFELKTKVDGSVVLKFVFSEIQQDVDIPDSKFEYQRK